MPSAGYRRSPVCFSRASCCRSRPLRACSRAVAASIDSVVGLVGCAIHPLCPPSLSPPCTCFHTQRACPPSPRRHMARQGIFTQVKTGNAKVTQRKAGSTHALSSKRGQNANAAASRGTPRRRSPRLVERDQGLFADHRPRRDVDRSHDDALFVGRHVQQRRDDVWGRLGRPRIVHRFLWVGV